MIVAIAALYAFATTAIVYPPGRRPYVLVVLTRGIQDGGRASRLIADISSIIYAHSSAATGRVSS